MKTERDSRVEPETCERRRIDRAGIEDLDGGLVAVRVVDEEEDEAVFFRGRRRSRDEDGLTRPLAVDGLAMNRGGSRPVIAGDPA